ADPVVRLRPGAIDGDLELHALAVESAEAIAHPSGEERGVGQKDQLAAVRLGSVLGDVEDVRSQERLAARDVDAFDAESGSGVDYSDDLAGRQTGNAARPRGDEAVRTSEIASVVDLQPELAKTARLNVGGATGVALTDDGEIEQHRGATQRGEEIMHVQPCLSRFQAVRGGVARHERGEGQRCALRGGRGDLP